MTFLRSKLQHVREVSSVPFFDRLIVIRLISAPECSADSLERWERFAASMAPLTLSQHPGWLDVLHSSLAHRTFLIEATHGDSIVGLLPLCQVQGPLLGRTLSSLPYLNYGGALAADPEIATAMISEALNLASSLGSSRLLLRHSIAVEHHALRRFECPKINVRRELPSSTEGLDASLSSSTRSQVRKGRKNGLSVVWGGEELLAEFYDVFSRNMRDLGTPVYSMSLFREALRRFPHRAELCVVRLGSIAVAASLLAHGWGITEVPSASSLREFNKSNANMLMYWHLLERSIVRGQSYFDFGRCTAGDSVFKFKEQWGGRPLPAQWQIGDWQAASRPERIGPGRHRLSKVWRRLPLPLSRWIGPAIVRRVP